MVEVDWGARDIPRQYTEEDSAFKEMLITIVRDALISYEDKGEFDEAARFARALDDKGSEERLLWKIMVKKDTKPWEYRAAGLLAIGKGDIGLAEEIIGELEKDIGNWRADEAIVNIAIKLPYKTTARRAMRLFEGKRDYGQVLNIAAAIGDRETCERLIKKMVDEGQLLYHTDTEWLAEAASYSPALGKKLVKKLLTLGRVAKDREEWYVSCAGEVSAALGDRLSAEKAFDYLMENKQRSFCQLKAGKIAVALGNIEGAEESVWGARATLFKFDFWDRGHLNDLGYIIGSVAKRNVEAAERIWKYVGEEELVNPSLPFIAVGVLEIM